MTLLPLEALLGTLYEISISPCPAIEGWVRVGIVGYIGDEYIREGQRTQSINLCERE